MESETLLRNGIPIPLQRLPFLMLALLLEQPNQVVTREALQHRLWGPQGYLQFENGLHVAAAKLREALGDSAASPKFIKTIPRRGYQLVVDDLVVIDPSAPPASTADDAEEVPDSEITPSIPQRRKSDRPLRRRKSDLPFWHTDRNNGFWLTLVRSRRMHLAVGAPLCVVVLCIALIKIYRMEHNAQISPSQTVLLGAFYNQTNDSQLDGVYDFPFQLKMEESQYLHFTELSGPIQSVGTSGPKTLADELGQCRTAKANFLLTGLLERHGKGFQVRLSSWDCEKNRLLTSETDYANDPTAILRALDTAAINLRQDLGESDESLHLLDMPSAQATTKSIAALRAFHMGESKLSAFDLDEALSYYRLATDLDPQFASAFDRMGIAYVRKGELNLGKKAVTAAFRLRDHATDHERLSIASHFYDIVTYDLPLATQTYELWMKMYPNDTDPLDALSETYLKATAEPRKALVLEEKAVALNPHSEMSDVNLAAAHFELGDFGYFANRCGASSFPGNMPSSSMYAYCYLSFFVQGDEAAMQHEVEASQGAMSQGVLLDKAGDIAIYRGQLALAKQLFRQSRKPLLEAHLPNFAAWIQARQAILEATAGMSSAAKDDLLSAIEVDRNEGTLGLGAWTLAALADRGGAQSMAKEARNIAPTDTLLNLQILGCSNALLALGVHDPQDAIQSLSDDLPYDFGTDSFLAPAYYRGVSLEEQQKWSESIPEFQSVIDHRNIMPESIFLPLAKLELGHALKQAGDSAHAAALFHELDLLWAHADPSFEPRRRLTRYEQ